jgi:hypothetical protein
MIRDTTYGTAGLGPVVAITNGTVVDINGTPLLTNQCGVYENIGYLLQDQNAPSQTIQGNYTLREHFSNYSTSVTGLTVPPDQNNPIVFTQIRLGDTQYFGKTAPKCPAANDHESFDQSLTVIVGSSSYPLSTVNTIQRGYYSGTPNVTVTIKTP